MSSPRFKILLLPATLLVFALVFGTTNCSDADPLPEKKDWTPLIDQDRAFADLKAYAELGPVTHHRRDEDRLEAGRAFLRAKLGELGVARPDLDTDWVQLAGDNRKYRMRNFVGVIPGKSDEIIVLGAHYDMKILDRVPEFQGANDGASGVALVLEVGRHLLEKSKTGTLDYTVWLTFFDGEEAFVDWYGSNREKEPDNTYGSRNFLEEHEKKPFRALVLLDLVADPDLLLERDTKSTSELLDLFERESREIFGPTLFAKIPRPIADDHVNFVERGIPALDLIDLDYGPNHRWWHGAGDRVENCSPDSLQKVGTLVLTTWPKLEAWLRKK